MLNEFQIKTDIEYNNKIKKLLTESPPYLADYIDYWKAVGRQNSTLYISLRNICSFIKFEQAIIPECNDIEFSDIPIFIFDKLTENDLLQYWNQMHNVKFLTYEVRCKNMYSICSFYKFLNRKKLIRNNPFLYFEIPTKTINKPSHYFPEQYSTLLLDGILQNNKAVIMESQDKIIVPIPHKTWIKRERLVLRNYAICSLFLETDLRLSEVAGLDVSDVHFDTKEIFVTIKGSDKKKRIQMSDALYTALSQYINGVPVPDDLLNKYLLQNTNVYEWCKSHIKDIHISNSVKQTFSKYDDAAQNEILKLIDILRRHGRNGLISNVTEKALFVSTRCSRMTVRMIEYMIKEMVMTYLPDLPDNQDWSPEKFRKNVG